MSDQIPQNCTWVGGVSPADMPVANAARGEFASRPIFRDGAEEGHRIGMAKATHSRSVSRRQVRRILDGEQRREA